jgi:hypothetical protein
MTTSRLSARVSDRARELGKDPHKPSFGCRRDNVITIC